ncbi:DEAD/DEAH box helicase [Enhydrobacter sp.]|jgi:superfamily II DNA/RNA helicase|uniref:DEAD/DEAH box helicase n=1 Tax=Enhydrobacter sp. TaxID=1894999 RepID=UPI002618D425|nr:DEAD/DEAH box helicase [Enhydrobacter sp.]WIM10009.1 MAG: ATP-dependent RNA helicase [Enhydrobacter sp.]
MSFESLGLSSPVLQAVSEKGYATPTPIQEKAIPIVLMGRDVLGCAQTGTGKTASFVLPMIDILAQGRAKARMPRSLILEPTRELAAQVAENFDMYGKYNKLNMALLIGGVSFEDQERALERGVDVLIATPGRLLDHFERGKVLLNDVKVLVIDEADRMLDMGFIPDVERIVGLLPPLRQTLFFSATMPPEIKRLADRFLSNPREVTVTPPASTAKNIVQGLAVVAEEDKREALRRLIREQDVKNAIVFCNRKRDVAVLQGSLKKHGFNAGALHGDMSQPARMETLEKFKQGEIQILVASDVAARGLDIVDMSHVFNFDVPFSPEDYVHRIGRTGRAGKTGHSFTLASPDDGALVDAIEKLIGSAIPRVEVPGMDTLEFEPSDGRKRRGRGRGAKSGSGERARSPRRERKPRDERPIEQQVEAPVARETRPPRPARERRPEREHHREPRAERPSRSHDRRPERRRERDDSAPIGLGDHVPAFLARPAR